MERTIADVVSNKEGLYDGNVEAYFKAIVEKSSNNRNPYHNINHTIHVVCECYDGAVFYRLAPWLFRTLLIKALHHDDNHPGLLIGTDDLWIEIAARKLRANILPEDRIFLEDITQGMKSTEFQAAGHVVPTEVLAISNKILRDADMSQSLASRDWIQQIMFGLSAEMRVTPKEMLFMQEKFLSGIEFATEWGVKKFGPLRDKRILEVRELVRIMS